MAEYDNVMIDIETLGQSTDSVVLSVAVVPFNFKGEIHPEGLKLNFPLQTQLEMGRVISQSTIDFWSEKNGNPFSKPSRGNDIDSYLIAISAYISNLGSNIKVWANSPKFDIVILEDLYKSEGLKPIWKNDDLLDVRTITYFLDKKGRTGRIVNQNPNDPIEDSIYQIKSVLEFSNEYLLHGE